jgi:hypothetical protein
MGIDFEKSAASVDHIMFTLAEVAKKHVDDDVGKLTLSAIKTAIPSIGRLRLNERNTSEAALVSIASSVLLVVAAASRRRSLLDEDTIANLQSAARGAVSLLGKASPPPRKSIPVKENPPSPWKKSPTKFGGFERAANDGIRMHIIKDIHVTGSTWVLHYSGLMIDMLPSLADAASAATKFDEFMSVKA